MKALNFVIGMIVGMILIVVAVLGAIFAAASLVSIGQIENTLGTDIFDDESSVNDKSVLEFVQALVGDLQKLDGLTINRLKTDYGLKIPSELSGIDISVLFDYPLTQVGDHLGDIVNNMTMRDVGEFLGMDFENDYDLPVLKDNLDNNVNVALDNILKSIDSETATLYTIERDFGISLDESGENKLFSTLYYTPLNTFGGRKQALHARRHLRGSPRGRAHLSRGRLGRGDLHRGRGRKRARRKGAALCQEGRGRRGNLCRGQLALRFVL